MNHRGTPTPCTRCGVVGYRRYPMCGDCRQQTAPPPAQACACEVTQMRNGWWRAECGCGYWSDHSDERTATRVARAHELNVNGTIGCQVCTWWISAHDPADYTSHASYLNSARMHHWRHKHGKATA